MTEKENITEESVEEINETAEENVSADENTEAVEADDKSLADIEKELNDKYLRLFAEFDNYKKRTAKEKTSIYTNAAADVIEAVLPMLDNLDRASQTKTESDEAGTVVEGIMLIKKQFESILSELGVKPIEALGKEFDPNFHNAVMHIDDESVDGNDIIVEEFVKGYMYKDKVVRHSTVKVAN